MPSLEQVRTRKYLRKGVIGQVGDNGSTVFTMRYIGGGTLAAGAVVVDTTFITLVSTNGTTTHTDHFHFATPADYPTTAELAAAINATGRWEVKILDCLSIFVLVTSSLITSADLAADVNGNYNIMGDTGTCLFMAYRLTYDRTFATNAKVRQGHRVSIQEIVTTLTLGGGADANAFKIYECVPGGNSESYPSAETLIYQKTPVTGSTSTLNWASGHGEITGNEGNDLLVIISDGTSFAATDVVTVVGETE